MVQQSVPRWAAWLVTLLWGLSSRTRNPHMNAEELLCELTGSFKQQSRFNEENKMKTCSRIEWILVLSVMLRPECNWRHTPAHGTRLLSRVYPDAN